MQLDELLKEAYGLSEQQLELLIAMAKKIREENEGEN
jgi:hypothetical protein